jgi:predicted NACHT family NTPase
MLDWAPIIQKGVETLAPELFKAAIKSASKSFQQLRPYTVLNFDDHFATAFRRCTKIKTIVSGDSPVDLLTNYVNLNFRNRDKTIDDYALIDLMWKQGNVVVSGPAGCGKSMFMKYLWISCFVHARDKIPLFIELRQLNNIESIDFVTYLFHSCLSKKQKEARDLFDKAIEEGQFFFILDGFDELTLSKVDVVEREIIKLTNDGKNVVVVSGRPDDRFGAWLTFVTYRVEPLTKKQVVSLIGTIEFDQIVKKKFIAQIKTNLYDKHKDFISRPLLATMMLLTYNSFAEIPDRIHVFYDQAFDTLFSRHDATKEAFKRERYTTYPIDEFKRVFGIFCLVTYVEQETDFTDATIRENIKKAGKIARVSVDADGFLRDLMDAVCVLQRDGLSIVFSHRSFQEYFCAYAFLRLSREEAKPVALRLSERRRDNVIPMIFEMNRSLLEDVYVIPMMEHTGAFFAKLQDKTKIREILDYFNCGLIVQLINRKELKGKMVSKGVYVQVAQGNSAFDFLYWILSVYGNKKKLVAMELMTKETDFQYLMETELLTGDTNRSAALFYSPPADLPTWDFCDTTLLLTSKEMRPKALTNS